VQKYGRVEAEKKYKCRYKNFGFTLDKYIERFGLERGPTLYKKDLEKIRINKAWYIKRYGEELGIEKYKNKIKRSTPNLENYIRIHGEDEGKRRYYLYKTSSNVRIGKASKQSLNVLLLLRDYVCSKYTLPESSVFIGVGGSQEWFLREGKDFFLYDFCIPSFKVIIEYNGEHVHPNPLWKVQDELKWNTWLHPWTKEGAEVSYRKDSYKVAVAEKNGFRVLNLWSSCAQEDNLLLATKFVDINYQTK
jgi:hypothetical protein